MKDPKPEDRWSLGTPICCCKPPNVSFAILNVSVWDCSMSPFLGVLLHGWTKLLTFYIARMFRKSWPWSTASRLYMGWSFDHWLEGDKRLITFNGCMFSIPKQWEWCVPLIFFTGTYMKSVYWVRKWLWNTEPNSSQTAKPTAETMRPGVIQRWAILSFHHSQFVTSLINQLAINH